MKIILITLMAGYTAFSSCPGPKKESKILTGHFLGGNCVQEGSICGNWFIKPDSTFYYVSIIEGNITSIGRGRVIKFLDSAYTFQFDNSLRLPGRQVVSTLSYSNSNYDSLYVKVIVERKDKQSLVNAPMIFLNGKFSNFTNQQGAFEKVMLPVSPKLGTISIIDKNLGVEPIEIIVDSSLNHHEIKAVIPGLDSTYCEIIGRWQENGEKLRYEFPINRSSSHPKSNNFRLQYSPEKLNQLIVNLKQSKLRQPYLSGFIDDFLLTINLN